MVDVNNKKLASLSATSLIKPQ